MTKELIEAIARAATLALLPTYSRIWLAQLMWEADLECL